MLSALTEPDLRAALPWWLAACRDTRNHGFLCTCRVIPSNACVTPLRALLGSESGHLDQRKYANPTARRFFAADIVGRQTTKTAAHSWRDGTVEHCVMMANYSQLKIVITAALLAALVGQAAATDEPSVLPHLRYQEEEEEEKKKKEEEEEREDQRGTA